MGQQISGNTVGTYELTATVTLQGTGETFQTLVAVEVTPGIDVPVLKPTGSEPDAIPIAEEQEVIFTAILADTERVPDAVVLEELDGAGNPVAELGPLADDGSGNDLAAGDMVYSGTFSLFSAAEGNLRYRAKAVFEGGAETYIADECVVGVTRFPIDLEPSNAGSVVTHPETGNPMISNQLAVAFVEGTTPDAIESVVAAIGGTVVGTLFRLGFYYVEVPDTGDASGVLSAADTLLTYPQVETAETVSVGVASVSPVFAPNDSHFLTMQFDDLYYQESPYYIVRADEAWQISRGTGEDDDGNPAEGHVIAVLDTGLDLDHPEFFGKVRRGKNLLVPRTSTKRWVPRDNNGHGTVVAGIAAAGTDNGIGMAGMSWDSPILVYKVLDGDGSYLSSNSASAIRSAVDRGAKIINMSYGSFSKHAGEQSAVEYALGRGALLIAAAGNEETKKRVYPAAYNGVMAVGTIVGNIDDGTYSRASYSNYGEWVSIAAPAGDFSTIPLDKLEYADKTNEDLCSSVTKPVTGCYGWNLRGTSFSAPMVSGAAALLWSDRPYQDALGIRYLLEATAVKMPGTGLGAGRLDAFEAIFNGSFEADWSTGWTASARKYMPPSAPSSHAVVNTINSIQLENGTPYYIPLPHPVRGHGEANRNMIYIGNEGSAVTETTLSKTFNVQPGVNEVPLSFDYYFISEEVPEYLLSGGCGRCTCNLFADGFGVEVTSPSGTTNYIYLQVTESLDTGDWGSPSGWNLWLSITLDIGDPGGAVRPYDLGDYLYGTPLSNVCPVTENLYTGVVARRVRNQLIPITEGPGEYTISIFVNDWADEIGDSAIVIDNIRFRPE